ncbi:MAG TPA: M23 family metallopeptidase [Gemmatimonadaceae bacterium]|nr:M23 family metallopeptidase [Gemmatimonadaceae bacterium]
MKPAVSVLAVAFAVATGAQETKPVLTAPAQAMPGAVVRISLNSSGADSVIAVEGSMSGEPLHFHRAATGAWHAIGAISPDAKTEATARAIVSFASGRSDTISDVVQIPGSPPSRGKPRALAVSPRFTQPLDAETQARIDRENATAREIGRASHDTPRLWSASFMRPRSSVVTSRFGSGRMFNGTLTSRHLGVDFRGKTGDPIVAANRGVVALVGDFFLAGNVVYIDHGNGVVTAYFHMSKPLVAKGDTVARGQTIGLIGSTGRVTGPHLHWSARYGALTVNPLDLVALSKGW